MGFFAKLAARAVVLSLSLLYGSLVLAYLFLRLLRRPSRPFWYLRRRDAPPAVLGDPQWGSHKYMQLKDIKLHYVENGDQSKPLMLFLHGFPEFWFTWRHQLKEFASDYWVVALDMRGYGDSDKPEGRDQYRMKYLIGDIKELITAFGRDKCILVSHDWGGAIGWQFVLNFPEMVDKYIIMDAPHPRAFRKHIRSTKQFLMSWYMFFFQLPYLPEMMMRSYDMASFKKSFRKHRPEAVSRVTDEDIEAFKYTFGKPGAYTGPINYYRANFGTLSKTKRNEEKKLPPGMLINGEKDDYLSGDLLSAAKDYVEDLKIEIIKGANHFVQQDDPEAVNKTMREFLKE